MEPSTVIKLQFPCRLHSPAASFVSGCGKYTAFMASIRDDSKSGFECNSYFIPLYV